MHAVGQLRCRLPPPRARAGSPGCAPPHSANCAGSLEAATGPGAHPLVRLRDRRLLRLPPLVLASRRRQSVPSGCRRKPDIDKHQPTDTDEARTRDPETTGPRDQDRYRGAAPRIWDQDRRGADLGRAPLGATYVRGLKAWFAPGSFGRCKAKGADGSTPRDPVRGSAAAPVGALLSKGGVLVPPVRARGRHTERDLPEVLDQTTRLIAGCDLGNPE